MNDIDLINPLNSDQRSLLIDNTCLRYARAIDHFAICPIGKLSVNESQYT